MLPTVTHNWYGRTSSTENQTNNMDIVQEHDVSCVMTAVNHRKAAGPDGLKVCADQLVAAPVTIRIMLSEICYHHP